MVRELRILEDAANDLAYLMQREPRLCKKLGALLDDIQRNGNEGIGKPEPLMYGLQGWWSRRITDEHRLIYRIEDNMVIIGACRYHYDK